MRIVLLAAVLLIAACNSQSPRASVDVNHFMRVADEAMHVTQQISAVVTYAPMLERMQSEMRVLWHQRTLECEKMSHECAAYAVARSVEPPYVAPCGATARIRLRSPTEPA
jgi:hypothetical protein